jgi:hypothetical protein
MKALGLLVSDFKRAMMGKLLRKHEEGVTGWDDPRFKEGIKLSLQRAADRGEWVNVANYSAMLWNMEQE